MSTIDEKLKILQDTTLKNLDKKFGKESYYLGKKEIPKIPTICSSGSLGLDFALGIGGFPEGRIIEIGGQESSGKSTLTLINIAECQRNGKLCAYLDVEQAFDPTYAKKLGVNTSTLLILQPTCMEDAFEQLFELLNSKVISLIVVDSTNAMIPRKMLEGDTDTANMGKTALLMSQQLPKVVNLCSENKCTVIFISQIRMKIGVLFGSPEKIGLGESMKFYASVRIKTSKADAQKNEEEGQSAVDVVMNIFKNKVGVPFKKVRFTLLTGEDGKYGIDTLKEIIDYAVKFEIINKAGAWYSYGEERLGQGSKNVKKLLIEDTKMQEEIKTKVVQKLKEENDSQEIGDSFISVSQEPTDKPLKKRKKKIKEDENNFEEIAIVESSEPIKTEEIAEEPVTK